MITAGSSGPSCVLRSLLSPSHQFTCRVG
jgi:hypothetical protein